jgi:hypothetical protein
MKRFLLIFMLCVTANVVFAQEMSCKVVKPSPFYIGVYEPKYMGDLKLDDIITVRDSCNFTYTDFHPNPRRDFFILFNEKYWCFPQNLIPIETDVLFYQDVLTDTSMFIYDKNLFCKEMWVPVHYADVLYSRDRETLLKHEPRLQVDDDDKGGYERVYGTSEWYDVKYYGIEDGMIVFFNPIIYSEGGNFLVKTIEKHYYGYKVKCFAPSSLYHESLPPSKLKPYFNWSLCTRGTITMFLYIDGECMDIFINGTDVNHKFGTIIKVKEEFISQFQNLIKNGKCDLTNVIFPRRADGSTDYMLPEFAIDADLLQTEDKTPEAAIEKKAITKNNGKASAMPLWAWFAVIGGAAVVVGGGIFIRRNHLTK